MCIAYPGRVIAIDERGALIDIEGRRQRASLLLEPGVAVGDWVVVAAGTIIETCRPRRRHRCERCSMQRPNVMLHSPPDPPRWLPEPRPGDRAPVSGPTLFARYAYGPNRLGLCGPDDAASLFGATTGEPGGRRAAGAPAGAGVRGGVPVPASSSGRPTASPIRSTDGWSRPTGWGARCSTPSPRTCSVSRCGGASGRGWVSPPGDGWIEPHRPARGRCMPSTSWTCSPRSG